MMYEKADPCNYVMHGLSINSPVCIPHLIKTDSPADVRISFAEIAENKFKDDFSQSRLHQKDRWSVRTAPNAIYFHWGKIGKAIVRNGCEAIVEVESDLTETDLAPFLTGPIMGALLHQRGYFVLHASAVEINGVQIGFMGAKGYGKSTLAAHLQVRGHKLISDDLVPVKFTGGQVWTVPGCPRIKLYDDSIEAVGGDPDNFARINRFMLKRAFPIGKNFSVDPVKVDGFVILASGDEISLRELNFIPAFTEILKNIYFNNYLEAANYEAEHFEKCRKLIETIPIFELTRPVNFGRMDEVINLLEELAVKIKSKTLKCPVG